MSIKAYRVFRLRDVDGGHPKLRSVYFDVTWPKNDPMIEAECFDRRTMWWGMQLPNVEQEMAEAHEEIAPHDGCADNRNTNFGCGIYSVVSEEKARKWKDQSTAMAWAEKTVTILAEVEIWGKTVPHELGYRSQFCRIIGIIPLRDRPSDIEETIAYEYDLPLIEEEEDG